jgi:ABC-type oligopeptide transport system substrate-binding subunit/class 3 adenylate cyclase
MNQREQLEQAIRALEGQRALLGDAVVETALAPLHQQLATLDAQATAAQRKQVTVLFADVSGFTAMSEQLDAEEVGDTMNALWARLDAAISAQGGTIDKHIGDAVMALFGAPTAHEDDPERAVRAALAMQQAIGDWRLEIVGKSPISNRQSPISIRIGINTGPVLLGQVATTAEYTAMGDTVNLASRLEHAAPVGGILISHATYRHVRGIFDVQVLDPIQVKGKREPVQVYVVRRAKPRAFRVPSRGVEGVETRMVGRDAELQQLQDALDAAIDDHETRVVTVVGEAGVGKSRLLYEFDNWVEVQPQLIRLFKARARPEMTIIPYALIRDLFAFRFEIHDSDSVTAVREKLERGISAFIGADEGGRMWAQHIGHLLGFDFAGSSELRGALDDPRQFHDRALAHLNGFFALVTAQQPTVIFLEDIHWADDRSLDFINHLAQRHPNLQLLIVCLTRPTLFERRRTWGEGQTYHSRLDLRPLSKRQSRQLVEEILQKVDEVPAELRDLIVNGAEGNPFYVEELIKMLIDDGVIVAAAERWHVETSRLAEVRVPPTLTGVLQARLDGLPPKERELLQRAAVVGRIFWDGAVAQLRTERDTEIQNRLPQEGESEIQNRLMALRGRELIYERELSAFVDSTEYIFKHALLRDVTYESVLRRVRKAYHAQVAAWLVAHSGERIGEYLALIAEHYEHAGDSEKAADYLLRAGDRARAVAAYSEAIDAYVRALALLKQQGEHERAARTLMKLGLTYHQTFDFEQSRQAYDEGFALWQKAGEAPPATPPPPAPHALRVDCPEITTLDPTRVQDAASAELVAQLFSGLVDWTPELDVVPDVARSWEVLDGGRTYVFHLRDDVRWSDSAPVTASDFVYAWRRVLAPATRSPSAALLFDIKGARAFHDGDLPGPDQVGVRAGDPLTLVVELEEPAGYFLHLLGCVVAYPVPQHVVAMHGAGWIEADKIVTNGPFLLEAWQPRQSMVLVRNPSYHRRFAGNLQRVELALGLESPARLELYEMDRLDVAYLLPAEMDLARQRHAGEHISFPSLETDYIGFNVSQPPFDDRRVRQAFVLATDRETLAAVIKRGYAFPAGGGFIPPGMPGHSPGIGLPYDPEQARQLLTEAGYPGGRGFPAIVGLSGTGPAYVGEYLGAQWRESLGVTVTWETTERAIYYSRLNQESPQESPQLFGTSWVADYPDPDNFLRVGFSERSTHWQHADYAGLVEQARRLTDQRERLKRYQQADQILVDEAPILPLYYDRTDFLIKPWVKKYPTSAIRGCFWKDVVIEPH